MRDFSTEILPHFDQVESADTLNMQLKPLIDKEFALEEVAAAHQYVQDNRNIGKVLLRVHSAQKEEL